MAHKNPPKMAKVNHVECAICRKKDSKVISVREGFSLMKCPRCSLVFFGHRSKEELRRIYIRNRTYAEYYEDSSECDRKEFYGRLMLLHRLLESRKLKGAGKILDVGCATGNFLEEARKAGWETYGVELNKLAVRECKRKGLNVKQGALTSTTFKQGHFDAITLSDTIEHLEDPVSTLKICRQLLKKGGLLMITTPNWSSPFARKFQFKPFEHLYYFTSSTLQKTAMKAGFKTITCHSFNRRRNIKAMRKSNSFKQGTLSKMVLFMFDVIPGKSLCVKFPFYDDLLMVSVNP